MNGFIRTYDGTRCLVLFDPEKYDIIYNRIRDIISPKSSITYIFSNYYLEIKVDSYDSLPIEKILTLHDAVILIKSVLNNDKNHYYYKIFLEKFPYQLAKKQSQICVHRIIMVRFRDREIAKKNVMLQKAYKNLGC